jgi:hypothetical protein
MTKNNERIASKDLEELKKEMEQSSITGFSARVCKALWGAHHTINEKIEKPI